MENIRYLLDVALQVAMFFLFLEVLHQIYLKFEILTVLGCVFWEFLLFEWCTEVSK